MYILFRTEPLIIQMTCIILVQYEIAELLSQNGAKAFHIQPEYYNAVFHWAAKAGKKWICFTINAMYKVLARATQTTFIAVFRSAIKEI